MFLKPATLLNNEFLETMYYSVFKSLTTNLIVTLNTLLIWESYWNYEELITW